MQPGAPHTASLPAGCAHGSTPLPGTRRGLRAAAGTQAPLHQVKTKCMLARDLCTPCMSPQGKRCFLPHLTSGVTALTATSSFQESVDRKRQARGARAVVRGGGSCGSEPLGAARLVAAPVVLLLGLVLPEVFAQCLFLSPTISVYHVGSWQVHLKYV